MKMSLTVFSGIGNVTASDVVRAVSYLESRDIVHRDVKPANVLVSIPIMKVTNTKNWRWHLAKNLLSVNLVIWGIQDLGVY